METRLRQRGKCGQFPTRQRSGKIPRLKAPGAFHRDRREPYEFLTVRVDRETARLQRGYAEQRFRVLVAEDDNTPYGMAAKLDLAEGDVHGDDAVRKFVLSRADGFKADGREA